MSPHQGCPEHFCWWWPVRKVVLRLCWLPAATWLAGWLYIQRFEGWGQWAAAPVLVPSLLLSAGLGITGLALLIGTWRRNRKLDVPLFLATLLAALVILFVSLRNILA